MKTLAPSASESQPISTHIENGRLAKGAKTPEGLARSARNATKHGLSGRSFALLSNEDPEQYEAVRNKYIAAFNPRDPIELNFVNQFVEAYWLQQRCNLYISQTLSQEIAEQRDIHKDSSPGLSEMHLAVYASATFHDRSNLIQIYERYRSTHTRNMLRFHSALIRHRAAFGATASLPDEVVEATPDSMFLPGPIGPPAPAESTNYETNSAPEAPQPSEPPTTDPQPSTSEPRQRPFDPQQHPTDPRQLPTEPRPHPTEPRPQGSGLSTESSACPATESKTLSLKFSYPEPEGIL